MASPLGLVNIPRFNSNGFIDGSSYTDIKYVSGDKPSDNVMDTNYTGDYNSVLNGTKWYHRPSGVSMDGGKVSVRSSKRHDTDRSGIDDIYDISTNSIINYTNNVDLPALKLNPAHFVYLKDYGVYPNNRLLICRRFPSPVENDLTAYSNTVTGVSSSTLSVMSPLSTIVSWVSDSADNFFSFESSETWEGAKIDDPVKELSDIFNKVIGKVMPFTPGGEMGGGIGAIAGAFPMGGISETLETTIMNYLLGTEGNQATNFNYDNLHKGNPNFMGESSYRNVNSIVSKISIPVKVVYEMKYIPTIDPTIAFMDVVQNILRFSSSQSVFYLSQSGGDKINDIIEKFKNGDWQGIIGDILETIVRSVKDLIGKFTDLYKKGEKVVEKAFGGDLSVEEMSSLSNSIVSALSAISRSALARYRIEFNKIIPAMTGFASAPWHVTIGNPKNPFFSSGDMIVEGGKVTFGNIMGFNDLPTRIEFEFTIKSARNLGIQEIFDKFNVGAGRQYQRDVIKFEIDWNQGRIKDTLAGVQEDLLKDSEKKASERKKELEKMVEDNADYRVRNEDGEIVSGPLSQEESEIRRKESTDKGIDPYDSFLYINP